MVRLDRAKSEQKNNFRGHGTLSPGSSGNYVISSSIKKDVKPLAVRTTHAYRPMNLNHPMMFKQQSRTPRTYDTYIS